MRVFTRVLCVTVVGLLIAVVTQARGEIAINQITDINNTGPGFGNVNLFSNLPIDVDDTGVFMNNDVAVFTLTGGGAANGSGVSVGISNGENGWPGTIGTPDIDNATPTDSIFTTIGNASGKLENGNAIRFSMWMRSDPTDPVTKEPQIEPVVKIELWKEALSGNADFSNVAFPGGGDRIWDTDQNAGNAVFDSFNQSRADWVDVNNNGTIFTGNPVSVSLVTEEWRLVETVLVVDDDPLNDTLGWSIGTGAATEFFTVEDVEEIRAVMFVGDFAATDLTDGGNFFIDNLMVEVFADEATMLATANPNTAPIESAGIVGDYNDDMVVDVRDYAVWRTNNGMAVTLPNDSTPGTVGPEDYDEWVASYGMSNLGSGSVTGTVPEPTAAALAIIGLLAMGFGRRRRIS